MNASALIHAILNQFHVLGSTFGNKKQLTNSKPLSVHCAPNPQLLGVFLWTGLNKLYLHSSVAVFCFLSVSLQPWHKMFAFGLFLPGRLLFYVYVYVLAITCMCNQPASVSTFSVKPLRTFILTLCIR